MFKLLASLLFMFLLTGCATWEGIKKDTASIWEVIANKSSDVWKETKEKTQNINE